MFYSSSCRLVGLVIKASASRAADPEFDSRFRRGDFSMSHHASDFLKNGTLVAACQTPGVVRSALGLVGPVPVYFG